MFLKKSVTISSHLFNSLSPFLRLNRFFCLLPLEWEIVNANYVIRRSTTFSIYSLATLSLLVTTCLYGASQVFGLGNFQKSLSHTTTAIVTYANVVVVIFCSVSIVILTLFKTNKYIDFIECLKKADNCLMKTYEKNMLLPKIFISYTLAVITFGIVTWSRAVEAPEHSFFLVLLYYISFHLCYFIYIIVELVYWQAVTFIKMRLVTINSCLSEMFGSHSNGFMFTTRGKKQTSNIVDAVKFQYGTGNLKKIQDSIKAYEVLVEASVAVNEGYGLTILITMLGFLFHIIVSFHVLYSVLVIQKEMTVVLIINQVLWVVLHSSRLLLIVEPCHGCLSEVEDASNTICKLLNFGLDEEIEKSLNFFLMFMSRCKIQFTAYDLTSIHRGILATIAGAVTTYLVILFQFN